MPAPLPSQPPRITALGKIPSYGDFLRVGSLGPAWQSFDAWVQRGLYAVRQVAGATYKARMAQLPPTYVLHSTSASVLLGAFRPSTDRVGRMYPFIAGIERSRAALPTASLPRLPLRWARGLRVCEAVTAEAVADGTTPDGLRRHISDLEPLPDARAHAVWDKTLHATPVRALLDGHEATTADGTVALHALKALSASRHRPLRMGVRLPLYPPGQAHELSTTAQVVFWLQAIAQVTTTSWEEATVCWSAAPNAASVLCLLRVPAAYGFPHLLPGARADDHVADLTEALSPNPDPAVAALLRDDSATLHDLLHAL